MLERGRKTIRPQHFSAVSPSATQAGWDLHRASSLAWRKLSSQAEKGQNQPQKTLHQFAQRTQVCWAPAPQVFAAPLRSCRRPAPSGRAPGRPWDWEGNDASCTSRPESWAEAANLCGEGSGPGNGTAWRLTMQRSLIALCHLVLPLRKGRCGLTSLSTIVHAWLWT